MNFPLICRFLGVISNLIGFSMLFSLPWAFEMFGGDWEVERRAFYGLLYSALICFFVGFIFKRLGKHAENLLLRKESMAIVAMSWILATILGSLPYLFSQTQRDYDTPMSVADAIFETQSGLSTTGASVISQLEDPIVVPRSILFWRSTTTLLGGVGFMALFVVLLGQGASGKAVLRLEQTKMSNASPQAKIRQTAIYLLMIYLGLNVLLVFLLLLQGVSFFDSLCHSFATIATGGFSTFNNSIGHFALNSNLNAVGIEWTLIIFMFISGSNFILLYWFLLGQPKKLLGDLEWRTYVGVIAVATFLILCYGLMNSDFSPSVEKSQWPILSALRVSLFHVISIMTTTGFITDQFELWNGMSLMVFIILMIMGACSGSTSGGTKLIRWVLVYRGLGLEIERSWRPNVIRSLKVSGKEIDRETISGVFNFLLFFCVAILMTALIVLMIEPNAVWSQRSNPQPNKIFDIISASLAMFSNIGPGFGVVGAKENYSGFTDLTKIIFSWAMLLGRLELFVVLAMFQPSFWKNR